MKQTKDNEVRVALSVLLLIAAILALPRVEAHEDLTFTTWTGPYMRSQMLGFVYPYEDETGKSVNVEHYAGGIEEIRNQVESANVAWDVVDLTQADSLRACKAGLLEELNHSVLPNGADGSSFQDDFIDGALNPCGVGVIVWATIFAYDNQLFIDKTPTTIGDFFDIKRFPGRRAIRKDPSVIMEWALLADGVKPDEVYSTLSTEAGIKQAFSKLDEIKPYIVWWKNGRDPVNLLNNNEVAMSSIWATTGVEGSKETQSHFSVEWDGRVIELDLFGIVKGSRHPEEAIEFIKYASSAESLAEQAKYLANGPTRNSSLSLIPETVRSNLPNGSLHGDKVSVIADAQWWADNHDSLAERFRVWAEEASMKGASGTVR
jgi:putative spermidine/putrescine transport system substrate-binding protein